MRMAETNRVTAIRMRFCIGYKGIKEFVEAILVIEEMVFLGDG